MTVLGAVCRVLGATAAGVRDARRILSTQHSALSTLFLALLLPASVHPQREPVLKQIRVPHHYYYREMYLPQVTSGPASASWSPGGRELVYAMQGSLWRQQVGTAEAVQLTDGPGYDHQPDWSPDGRFVAYTSYHDDALELRMLELATGESWPLVKDGAVNLDPRWSPDGSRIVFVSTAHEGRWHVYLLAVRDGRAAEPPTRITADTSGGLPRYYYSAFDHYLSPAWSPDGSELLLVSNRGQIWGSGGIWRMEARAVGAMREIRNEETTWKARPDLARDGRRVVYSSYLGRQRNNLWLTTFSGGDPFQLTYCDCDHTSPRWSPDGRRIAYISNERGNTALQVITIPGGAAETVVARTRRYKNPTGRLRLTITDAAGRPGSARISVTGSDGRGWAPDDAWRHADEAFDRTERRFEATYFHASGSAELALPAGEYMVELTKGVEYRRVVRRITITAGATRLERLPLARLVNLPALGWWSGDLHVHMNYGGHYRNDPIRLRFQAEAEDVHVVENLIVNKEQRIPDIERFRGRPDPASTARTIIANDEEYHTSFWGHTGHLGLTRNLILPNYAGYANTAVASLVPDNGDVVDLARAQGAISGYVHPFDDPVDLSAQAPFSYALPVDVALGKVDYLEVMGFSDHLITAGVWYRLLNNGFRIPAGAGTDAMANFASLRGPLGLVRVFVRSGLPLDYRAWLDGIKAGRTFVTNGPILTFSVNGQGPGAEIKFPDGVHQITARASLRSIVPVDHLEIVANGAVVATLPVRDGGLSADTTVTLPVARSGWFTLRAYHSQTSPVVLDLYPFATTSPVYVSVGGREVRSASDARFFVQWIERIESATDAHTGWNAPEEKSAVMARLARAKAEFARRAGER